MANRVTITLAGKEYTILAEEQGDYVRKVAKHTDAKISELVAGGSLSVMDAAVLTAMNMTDEYFKITEANENLRKQMKEYLEEATKTKLELAEAKREIFKLQNKK